jgi:hypothetical protein
MGQVQRVAVRLNVTDSVQGTPVSPQAFEVAPQLQSALARRVGRTVAVRLELCARGGLLGFGGGDARGVGDRGRRGSSLGCWWCGRRWQRRAGGRGIAAAAEGDDEPSGSEGTQRV